MKKTILLICSAITSILCAQNTAISTFERFTLPTDSFYFNMNGDDFTDTNAIFQYDYDNNWMYWSGGFVYSNVKDSTTSGFTNQYATKAFMGYGSSNNYAVAQNNAMIKLSGASLGRTVSGFYITNSTYAHNSMRDGDAFAKKFGGTTGNDPDWFKITIRKYYGGALTNDSVGFYLADFRFSNNANDYIIKDWQWVNLTSLGNVDSLIFILTSSDVGQFGMNTPAYFCMDNFTATEPVGIDYDETNRFVLYPNPTKNEINIESNKINSISIVDLTGKVLIYQDYATPIQTTSISLQNLQAGMYFINIISNNKLISKRIIKTE